MAPTGRHRTTIRKYERVPKVLSAISDRTDRNPPYDAGVTVREATLGDDPVSANDVLEATLNMQESMIWCRLASMTTQVALLGAGGKMGCRITDCLKDTSRYDVRYVEPSEQGRERLAERGLSASSEDQALDGAEIVIMAVPDDLIGPVSEDVVPNLDSGSMVVLLDPAAAYAGVLSERDDISYFITHPSHPSIIETNSDLTDENPDWFGGQGREEQDIVCALHQGPEEDYERGEAIAQDIYGPVRRAHELTTEQMAILEPALVEMVLGACLYTIREAYEHAVEMGVPDQAARDFLFGHFRVELGIVFEFTDFPFSDGAQRAIEETQDDIIVPDWKERVFSEARLREMTTEIAQR